MLTITLTSEQLEAVTDALDTTLVELESDEANFKDYKTTVRYKALNDLYTQLLKHQLGV